MTNDRYEPTTNLRFLGQTLQQWYCLSDDGSPTGHLNYAVGEWRNVPVITEDSS